MVSKGFSYPVRLTSVWGYRTYTAEVAAMPPAVLTHNLRVFIQSFHVYSGIVT
jgi:hypothetical protein